jgi:hypothetical protein
MLQLPGEIGGAQKLSPTGDSHAKASESPSLSGKNPEILLIFDDTRTGVRLSRL